MYIYPSIHFFVAAYPHSGPQGSSPHLYMVLNPFSGAHFKNTSYGTNNNEIDLKRNHYLANIVGFAPYFRLLFAHLSVCLSEVIVLENGSRH